MPLVLHRHQQTERNHLKRLVGVAEIVVAAINAVVAVAVVVEIATEVEETEAEKEIGEEEIEIGEEEIETGIETGIETEEEETAVIEIRIGIESEDVIVHHLLMSQQNNGCLNVGDQILINNLLLL